MEERLKIIEKVKSGVTNATIFRENGTAEGTIRRWMKKEDRLRSFESDVGLQMKKAFLNLSRVLPLDGVVLYRLDTLIISIEELTHLIDSENQLLCALNRS